jgi:hypothetical protein
LFRLFLHCKSPPLARMMPPLDVVNEIGLGLGSRPVILPIHPPLKTSAFVP